MGLKNIRYYVWVCLLVLGSAGFYSVIVIGGVKQLISVDDNYLSTVYVLTFTVFAIFGLIFYVPRLRNVWLGGMMDKKYMSLWGSWIGIVVGAATGTLIAMPQVKKIDLLLDVPTLLSAAVIFIVFMLVMIFLSFYKWGSHGKQ